MHIEGRKYAFNWDLLSFTTIIDDEGKEWYLADEVVKELKRIERINGINIRRTIRKHVSSINKQSLDNLINKETREKLLPNYTWNSILISEVGFRQVANKARRFEI